MKGAITAARAALRENSVSAACLLLGCLLAEAKAKPKFKKKTEYQLRKERAAAKEKFAKTDDMAKAIGEIRAGYAKDMGSKDDTVRANATMTKLIDTIYARIGGGATEEETGSVGVTTLRKEHVTLGKNGLTLSFPGKSGVDWKRTIKDPALVKNISEFIKDKKDSDQIFPPNNVSLNDYLKSLSSVEVTAKDFRTFHANRIAKDELAKQPKPKTQQDVAANVKKVIETTAEALGHTVGSCKKSYIDPEIISGYVAAQGFAKE